MKKQTTPEMEADLIVSDSDITTMMSTEIAALVHKRHADVMRDIRSILKELNIGERKFAFTYVDASNRKTKCYKLPKRETLILVSGYKTVMRAAIIDRLEELEKPKPTLSRMAILEMAMDAERKAQYLSKQNQILTSKADALDRLSDACGAHSLRDSAKQLNLKPKEFNRWLVSNGWCYRNSKGDLIPYQKRLNSKVILIRSGEANGHSYTQPMITAKGLAKLSINFSGGE